MGIGKYMYVRKEDVKGRGRSRGGHGEKKRDASDEESGKTSS